jgi:predicted nucleic acid-binding protein
VTVVDASAVVAVLVDGGDVGDRARARLSSEAELHAPHLLDLEVASAVRKLMFARTITFGTASRALENLGRLNIRRHPHTPLMARIRTLWQNLTPYDGAYVALAEALGTPLVTCDARLARTTGPRCAIEVLSVRQER